MEITFLDAKDKNSLFIDIRSAYKYLQGTIPGSINIVENIKIGRASCRERV